MVVPRVVTGAVLGTAGLAKALQPCAPLQMTRELGFATGAPYLVPAVAGLEVGLAFLLLVAPPGSAAVTRASQVFLAALTCVLVFGMIRYGVRFRCACFGSLAEFHPLVSVVSNGVLLLLLELSGRQARRRGRFTAPEELPAPRGRSRPTGNPEQ